MREFRQVTWDPRVTGRQRPPSSLATPNSNAVWGGHGCDDHTSVYAMAAFNIMVDDPVQLARAVQDATIFPVPWNLATQTLSNVSGHGMHCAKTGPRFRKHCLPALYGRPLDLQSKFKTPAKATKRHCSKTKWLMDVDGRPLNNILTIVRRVLSRRNVHICIYA